MLRETKADVAIVNSGILGLNEDLAAGTRLRVAHVVDIFRFDDVVAVRSYPAKTVCKAIEHGLRLSRHRRLAASRRRRGRGDAGGRQI